MPASPPRRCCAAVLHRDTFRVAREGRRKFRMHYNRLQCTRTASQDGLCWQHAPIAAASAFIDLWEPLPDPLPEKASRVGG